MNNRIISNGICFDFLSKEQRVGIQKQLLKRLLLHSKDHHLLRKRIKSLTSDEINLNPLRALASIPSIESHTHGILVKNWKNNHICSQDRTSSIVFSSGGTTGPSKYILLSMEEVQRNAHFHGKGYAMAGIKSSDTVATFGLPGILSSEFTVYLGLQSTGCCIIPIGVVENPEDVVQVIEETKSNVLLVMPSDLHRISTYLKSTNKKLRTIRLIVTGGEALKDVSKGEFRKYFGTKETIFKSTFQTSDAGTIGFQCDFCKDNIYHVHEELQIVDVEKTEYGNELVVTNLDRYSVPVIKMKTGDLVEIQEGLCECGRGGKKIILKGRTKSITKIGGEKFNTSIFEELGEYYGLSQNQYSILIKNAKDCRDMIEVSISFDAKRRISKEDILNFLYQKSPTLKRQLENNTIAPVSYKNIKNHSLEISNTGKRVLVNDLR